MLAPKIARSIDLLTCYCSTTLQIRTIHHGRPEIAVEILDSTVRSRRRRLMRVVQVRVEPAVIDERPGMVESKRERPGPPSVVVSPDDEHVRAVVPGGVEEVVADDCVIVRVVVHPRDSLAGADRHVERQELVGVRDVHDVIVPVVMVSS